MAELFNICRICLESKESNASLYLRVQQASYLPSLIENTCGVVISSFDEPDALICKECSKAIVGADDIIRKCRESHKLLQNQRSELLKAQARQRQQLQLSKKEEKAEVWLAPEVTPQCKTELEDMPDTEETQHYTQNIFVEPEMFVESILENSPGDHRQELTRRTLDNSFGSECKEKKIRKRRARKKNKDPEENILKSDQNPALLYQSHFKTSRPKKSFTRSREQYLKRKIRNYPVKEPLTLIGGAGVVRKRKPKTYHRAIPNFYFRCELCHEFESNVASYAVTHLTTVHGIERPAIFRCSQCDAKPFIKNQSLQEHIATIHEQQPKKRDFACQECGKTFIKNCHLQKHLLSVHKLGEMPYKCKLCSKGYVDFYALRMHMKQAHHLDKDNDEHIPLSTLYQCDECGKSFVDMVSLNTHIKSTHPSEAEGFSCMKCGVEFQKSQKSLYETHVRRSICKLPCFVCRYCERTFAKLKQLEEHQREMH